MNYMIKWCSLQPNSRVVVVSDEQQHEAARTFVGDWPQIEWILADEGFQPQQLPELAAEDLLVVALSIDTFVYKGYNRWFSPFAKPKGLAAKYVFLRLDIAAKSLQQGLATPPDLLQSVLQRYLAIPDQTWLEVRNEAGTAIRFQIHPFTTGSHSIEQAGGMAFLPPSELEAGIIPHTANGIIVVDQTVGQINRRGEWLGHFGLVQEPVKLLVEHNRIVDIQGGQEATALREILFALEDEARVLVEFGKGLSTISPTGLIGVDECMINTCHFGIGDGACVNIANAATIHLDVVIKEPQITVLSE